MAKAGPKTAEPQDIRQIVNKNTQQRKRRRIVIDLILLLLFLLLLIGLGVMTYFIIYNSLHVEPKEVVLDINFETYAKSSSGAEETLDGWDIYHFKAGESSGTRTSTFNHALTADGELRLDYKINNVASTAYRYTIDFSDLEFDINENCLLEYSIKEEESDVVPKQALDKENGNVIEYSSSKNLTISVYFSVVNSNVNASCTGDIVFTISVV